MACLRLSTVELWPLYVHLKCLHIKDLGKQCAPRETGHIRLQGNACSDNECGLKEGAQRSPVNMDRNDTLETFTT